MTRSTSPVRPNSAKSIFHAKPWLGELAILLLAVVPAIGLLRHDFVFDSLPIIRENPSVHSLAALWQAFGQEYWPPPFIGLYRPGSIIVFSIQWAAGGGDPALFHAVSIALYGALALVVYRLARLVLPTAPAWATAALFAVHPVHTEAVASAVNQSELIVALLLTGATAVYIAGRRAGPLSWRRSGILLGMYAAACFTKEHGVVLPGLLAAAELTVVSPGRSWRERMAVTRPFYLASVAVGLGFIALRSAVLQGDLVGSFTAEALAGSTAYGRLLTMLAVVPEWGRLLLWPAHLQTEYTPQEIVAAMGWGAPQLLGLALVALAALGVVVLRRRQPVAGFAILWMAVALVPIHNVLAPTGVILAERTLLLVSVGTALLIGAGAARILTAPSVTAPGRRALAAGFGILILSGAWRTAARYPVWRDHFTAFRFMVIDAPSSYKAHFGYADLLAQRGRNAEAETGYRRAIELFPSAPRPYQGLGNLYRRNGLCWGAIEAYDAGLAQSSSSDFDDIRRSLIACLLFVGEYRRAGAEARIGIAGGRDDDSFRRFRQTADSALAVSAPPGDVRITME
jgi:hypothetical protein